MNLLLGLAVKDLWRSGREVRAHLVLVAMAGLCLFFSFAFRDSIDTLISHRAREFLSADVALSSMQPIPAADLVVAEELAQAQSVARQTELLAMARTKQASLLVEVKAIDSVFPQVGQIVTEPLRSRQDIDLDLKAGHIYVYDELLPELGVQLGESIQLGRLSLVVKGIVVRDPGISRSNIGIAPRIYMDQELLQQTGLVGPESQVTYRYFYQTQGDLEAITAGLKEQFGQKNYFVISPEESMSGLRRALDSFGKYLSVLMLLASLLGFSLAFYLFQLFVRKRISSMAVMTMFGAGIWDVRKYLLLQSCLLHLVGFVLSWLFGATLLLGINQFVDLSAVPGFVAEISWLSLSVLALLFLAVAVLFNLPFWYEFSSSDVIHLLEEDTSEVPSRGGFGRFLPQGIGFLGFLGLSSWLLGAGTFFLSFAASLIVFGLMAFLLMPLLLSWMSHKMSEFSWRFALRNLGRARLTTSLAFFSVFIIGLLFGVGPTLVQSSLKELETPDQSKLPAYFVINVPEESTNRLVQFSKDSGIALRYLSPLILVRLETINGEEVNQDELRRFPSRVTYRKSLLESERIVEGEPFIGTFDGAGSEVAPVSVEVEYAERRGFKLGDILGFNIQGIPFQARVANFRRIEWNSFHPNFFIQFPDGVLNDVPKTYVGIVYHSGSDEDVRQIKFEMSRRFPELSLIDLGRTLRRLADITRQFRPVILVTAISLVLFTLLFLLLLLSHSVKVRSSEILLMQIFGGSASKVRSLILKEFSVLLGFGLGFGVMVGLVLAGYVLDQIMKFQIYWSLYESFFLFAVSGLLAFVLLFLSLTRRIPSFIKS